MNEYRLLKLMSERFVDNELLTRDKERLAASCPACFGPRDDEAEKSQGKKPDDYDIIFCVDGNFQHSRNSNAKYNFIDDVPSIFLDESCVAEARRLQEATQKRGR